MFPILKELKNVGGQITTKELRKLVVMNTEEIPENILSEAKVSAKGRTYIPFNFALTNMEMAGFLKRPKRGVVELTEKGRICDLERQDLVD